MIRLQKNDDLDSKISIDGLNIEENINDEGLDNLDLDSDLIDDDTRNDTPQKQQNLNNFAQSVLSQIIQKDMPPLPSNYEAYFEQMLDDQDLEFQKKIYNLLETEDSNDDRMMNFEKNIMNIFTNTKAILKCTSSIYKNLTIMNNIEKQWCLDLKRGVNDDSKYNKDIDEIQKIIDEQNQELKLLYAQGSKIFEKINTNTMYDSKFDVYNKRYFIELVKDECKSVEKFQHTSTILMITISKSVSAHLTNDKTAMIVMKTIAKMLLKTSRRSDMIGYIGNGIFAMMLKYSDIFSSKKAAERLCELLQNTNIFLGDNEISLDIRIGIAKIIPQRDSQTSLNYAIASLQMAQNLQKSFVVYKDDEE